MYLAVTLEKVFSLSTLEYMSGYHANDSVVILANVILTAFAQPSP